MKHNLYVRLGLEMLADGGVRVGEVVVFWIGCTSVDTRLAIRS